MGKFWSLFFVLTAVIIVVVSWFSPALGWWFPGDGLAHSTIGKRIDDLFYMIMVIVAVTFIATQAVLGYVLWRGATIRNCGPPCARAAAKAFRIPASSPG